MENIQIIINGIMLCNYKNKYKIVKDYLKVIYYKEMIKMLWIILKRVSRI